MRIALIRYRLRLPGFDLPGNFRQLQQEYDDRSAALLENLAARFEGGPPQFDLIPRDLVERLEQMTREVHARETLALTQHIESFVTLMRESDALITRLARDIASSAEAPGG
jgi:multidrug resistance protein MdtO